MKQTQCEWLHLKKNSQIRDTRKDVRDVHYAIMQNDDAVICPPLGPLRYYPLLEDFGKKRKTARQIMQDYQGLYTMIY